MSHGDKVTALPPGFATIGSSDACAIAAMADPARGFYAVQFHPEVTHTKQGAAILARFAHDICGCAQDWNMADYVDEAVAAIRAQVGSEKVILGLSGGVDSSVAAALIHKAIGDQLTCVFVDHGLLRQDEATQVLDTFSRNLGVRVVHANAADEMYAALDGVADPEQKRRIIGRLFVDVFQRESARLAERGEAAKWLAQGTIYPDVIESAGAKTKKAHTIKSHHNVGGLPETLHLKLLEPLRELFKDEVRELGLALGPAARDGVPPSVSRPGPRRAHPGRGHPRARGSPAQRGCHLHRRIARRARRERRELVRPHRAGVRGVPAGPVGRRDGRRAHVRARRRAARRADHRFHDGALGAAALRSAREGVEPDHQRGSRHQPRRLRHFRQAAGDDRVGMTTATAGVRAPMWGATYVYVSNADDGDISTYRLDDSGELRPGPRVRVAKGVMPMAVSPDRRLLYAVSRSPPCMIHVLAIDPRTGALAPVSTSPLPESLPYISLDKTGRFLLGASYAASVVTVTAVGADGRVAPEPLQVIPVGRNAHSIRVDATNRFVYVPTLGSDAVFMFTFDAKTGRLASNTPSIQLTNPGAGPRHFVISGDNRFLYLLCEMTAEIVTFAIDAGTGVLTATSSVSGLAPDSTLGSGRAARRAADAKPRPRHLGGRHPPDAGWQVPLPLGAHRSTLNAFGVDGATGKLTYRSTHATERQPRGFAIDPSGRFVVAAGEKSDMISLYGIDAASGALEPRRRYPTGNGANWVEIVRFDAARLTTTGWARRSRWRARRVRAARFRWAR